MVMATAEGHVDALVIFGALLPSDDAWHNPAA
jgi:hypothetical protein